MPIFFRLSWASTYDGTWALDQVGVKAPGRPTIMTDLLAVYCARSTFSGGKPECISADGSLHNIERQNNESCQSVNHDGDSCTTKQDDVLCVLRLSPNTKLHQGASKIIKDRSIVQEWECRIQGYQRHKKIWGPPFIFELFATACTSWATFSVNEEVFSALQ